MRVAHGLSCFVRFLAYENRVSTKEATSVSHGQEFARGEMDTATGSSNQVEVVDLFRQWRFMAPTLHLIIPL